MWQFICECDRKYNWAAIAMYDIRHRCMLSRKSINFSKVNTDHHSQILDVTAIKAGAHCCYHCKSLSIQLSNVLLPRLRSRKRHNPRPNMEAHQTRPYAEISTISNVCSKTVPGSTYVGHVRETCPMSSAVNLGHAIRSITSLKAEYWKLKLTNDPNPEYVDKLLHVIEYEIWNYQFYISYPYVTYGICKTG